MDWAQRTQTPCKTKVNKWKFIALVTKIKLTRAILMPRSSNFWKIWLSIFPWFYIWKLVSWQSRFRWYAGYKLYQRYMLQFIPISNYKWRDSKLFDLVTGTETKPRLWGNILPNIKSCEHGWSNFSENSRIVALKLEDLTRFLLPNLSINSYLL